MRLRIEVGDATAIRGVPALVVPANKQLVLGWGSHVAERVLKLAGRDVEAEALAKHPKGIALGEAVVTSAGRMANFTHLIHAAVLDKYDFNPLFLLRLKERTSRETLARAVTASLQAAAAAGLRGLVFTPMGAGIGGMRDARCAEVMLEAFDRFGKRPGPSPVEEVVVACMKNPTADAFRGAKESP
jgi:O-acetyl-ADP-ribose deacetylase (regulator of RNase III)